MLGYKEEYKQASSLVEQMITYVRNYELGEGDDAYEIMRRARNLRQQAYLRLTPLERARARVRGLETGTDEHTAAEKAADKILAELLLRIYRVFAINAEFQEVA